MSWSKLEQAKRKWEEKLGHYEYELSITSSAPQKFELRDRIQECEQEIERIKAKINSSKEDNAVQIIEQNTQLKSSSQDRSISITNNKEVLMKDVFICHASEDKQEVVEPLVAAFKQANISYWYDKAEIKWGDSITKKVNEGLSISRFVIVILSSAFLDKNWPQRELYSVLNMEATSGEVKILPLIVGTNKQEPQDILQELPLLNDKAYLSWDGSNIQGIVSALSERLLPAPK